MHRARCSGWTLPRGGPAAVPACLARASYLGSAIPAGGPSRVLPAAAPRWISTRKNPGLAGQALGPLAPLAFVLILALQALAAPIPGEATGFLGGFLFGVVPGFCYSLLGLTLGSALAFGVARGLGSRLIAELFRQESLQRFDALFSRSGPLIAFLLFLFPGAPKDYLCLLLGLSKIPFKVFIVLVAAGRAPAVLLLTLQGAQVYERPLSDVFHPPGCDHPGRRIPRPLPGQALPLAQPLGRYPGPPASLRHPRSGPPGLRKFFWPACIHLLVSLRPNKLHIPGVLTPLQKAPDEYQPVPAYQHSMNF